MTIKFSDDLRTILEYSRDEAMRTGSYGIGAEHILLGIIRHADNGACRALGFAGVDTGKLKIALDTAVFGKSSVPFCNRDAVRLTKSAKKIIALSGFEALKTGSEVIFPSHMLLAICRSGEGAAAEALYECGADYDILHSCMEAHRLLSPMPEVKLPTTEEMLGPLGEQLTSLLGSVMDRTNICS